MIDKARRNAGIANWEHENRYAFYRNETIDFEKANRITLGFCNLPLPSPARTRALCFSGQPTKRAGGFVDGRHFTPGGAKLISGTFAAASRYFVVNSPSGRTIHPEESPSRILVFLVDLTPCQGTRELTQVHSSFNS
jgi:hypothetical protein